MRAPDTSIDSWPPMLLRDLQYLLGTVYGIDVGEDVHDYLITDVSMLPPSQQPGACRITEEKLLLQHDGDELGVALYLDSDLLARLSRLDPRQRLSGQNLSDFCTVLEGISHFTYVAWNASADKRMTLLELEMQAEVDKYVGARILLEHQSSGGLGQSLVACLFDEPAFHEQLRPEELARYRDATSFAGRYCRSLESRFAQDRLAREMVHELRNFYRLPQPAKVSHIQGAFFS